MSAEWWDNFKGRCIGLGEQWQRLFMRDWTLNDQNRRRMKNRIVIATAIIIAYGVFAQEPIKVDLSKMVGSPVAMTATPLTNLLLLYPEATNTIRVDATNSMMSATNIWISSLIGVGHTNSLYMHGVGLVPMTNRWALAWNIDNVIKDIRKEGSMPELVKKLVKAGDVCEVIGHKWKDGCGMEGCLNFHTVPERYCVICGKIQTKEASEWK